MRRSGWGRNDDRRRLSEDCAATASLEAGGRRASGSIGRPRRIASRFDVTGHRSSAAGDAEPGRDFEGPASSAGVCAANDKLEARGCNSGRGPASPCRAELFDDAALPRRVNFSPVALPKEEPEGSRHTDSRLLRNSRAQCLVRKPKGRAISISALHRASLWKHDRASRG